MTSCAFCSERLPRDKDSGLTKATVVTTCNAAPLCKKCSQTLFTQLGEGEGEAPLDATVARLGFVTAPDSPAHITHNKVAKELCRAASRTDCEVRRVLLGVLHQIPGMREQFTPQELHELRSHALIGAAAAVGTVASAANARREAEAHRRVMAECEAVLGRVVKHVERCVAEEQQAAVKAASRAAKVRAREESEVRAVLEVLLGRVERQATRDEREAADRARKEEAARARATAKDEREAADRARKEEAARARATAKDEREAADRARKEEAARAKAEQRESQRVLHEKRIADKLAAGGGKRRRCGSCAGCLAANCGTCSNCLDMPKFGGQGTRRQPCKSRACTGMLEDEVVSTWLQCDRCGKWRIVPDLPDILPADDESWFCEMNVDKARNVCRAPQQPDDAVLDPAVLLALAPAEGADPEGADEQVERGEATEQVDGPPPAKRSKRAARAREPLLPTCRR